MKWITARPGIWLVLVFLLAGCTGGHEESGFSVELAVTQTLEAIAQQGQGAPTQNPAGETAAEDPAVDTSGLPAQYPAQEACEQMAGLAAQYLNIPASISLGTFDEEAGLKGEGCSVQAAADGSIASVWGSRTTALIGQIEIQDWVSDQYFIGVGIGGMSKTYRKGELVCVYVHSAGPADNGLCNEDEPIWDCMARLPDADKEYKVTIDCTPDQQSNLSGMGPSFPGEGTQVVFDAGAASQVISGDLPSQAVARFVLTAAEGQTMTVTLTTEPESSGALSIWGKDGTVFLTGTEAQMGWEGTLPETQEYNIDLKNISDEAIVYQLSIEIPPAD